MTLVADSLEMSLLSWFPLDFFDLLFIVTAVVFNLQIMGIYIASRQEQYDLVRIFGIVVLAQAFPLVIIFANYLLLGAEKWLIAAFLAIFLYMAVELLFDFLFKIDFRRNKALHIPYIILFYLVEFSLIAIAFTIDITAGYLVSVSFWALMICMIYSLWPEAMNVFNKGELK